MPEKWLRVDNKMVRHADGQWVWEPDHAAEVMRLEDEAERWFKRCEYLSRALRLLHPSKDVWRTPTAEEVVIIEFAMGRGLVRSMREQEPQPPSEHP